MYFFSILYNLYSLKLDKSQVHLHCKGNVREQGKSESATLSLNTPLVADFTVADFNQTRIQLGFEVSLLKEE